jgi:hypothetical protein
LFADELRDRVDARRAGLAHPDQQLHDGLQRDPGRRERVRQRRPLRAGGR